MLKVSRPVLRWHGGKWKLADWLISMFPKHRVYVEPFGGAASVLMRKERSYAEIFNDMDEDVVNLFRVLRNHESAAELKRVLELTPFARTEHLEAYEVSTDPIERARQLIVLSFMGFGSNGHNRRRKTGFRNNSNRSGTTPAHDWANYPKYVEAFCARLQGVVIENRAAIDVMTYLDSPDTLHYVDPPYLPDTRSIKNKYDLKYAGGMYAHEMSTEEHAELLTFLVTLTGMVVLSGYPHASYDAALGGWRRIEKTAHADGARDRVEVAWLNPQASRGLSQESLCFQGGAV